MLVIKHPRLTHWLGVAFCHSTQDGLRDSEVVSTWANNGVAPKTPTEIRYIEGKGALWGAEASLPCERRQIKETAPIYSRFKLLLDPSIYTGVYADQAQSLLRLLAGLHIENTSSIRLPPGKTAIDVSTDYLKLLYNELMDQLLRKRFPNTLDVTPIEFVFTIPAIWSHKAQEATRYAAKAAGFCSRSLDTLSLVSEPEAAAMYVLRAMCDKGFSRISAQKSSLKKGEKFVICDAGGGTVDLISYEVEQEHPKFSLKESVVGSGAKCGSSYIDEAFTNLLAERLGSDCKGEGWFQKIIERGSTLMKTFDSIKRSFGQTTNDIWFLELGAEVPDNEKAGIVDSELELTAKDLKALFDPIVENVIQLIQDQVKIIQSQEGTEVAPTIFLVGGFGESQYLYRCLVEWAEKQTPSLVVINPTESWSAIMRGAIVHALQPAVRTRRLRQHYGFRCNLPFNPARHDISDAYECPFGGWHLRNSIQWTAKMASPTIYIQKGDECDNEKEIDFHVYLVIHESSDLLLPIMTPLIGCKRSNRPIFRRGAGETSNGVADFSSVDIATLESTMVDEASGRPKKRYKLNFVIKMKIGSADAEFSIWLGGRCVGRARVSHDDDDCEPGMASQLGRWLET
ncbi:hypothetical protein TWF281_001171 [Arthrobotrys megalospora]